MDVLVEIASSGVTQTVVGSLLTAIAALIALRVGARNEQDKWLREKRLEAFIEVTTVMRLMERLDGDFAAFRKANDEGLASEDDRQALVARSKVILDRATSAISAGTVLFPDSLHVKLNQLAAAITDEQEDEGASDQAFAAVAKEMKDSLKISG